MVCEKDDSQDLRESNEMDSGKYGPLIYELKNESQYPYLT